MTETNWNELAEEYVNFDRTTDQIGYAEVLKLYAEIRPELFNLNYGYGHGNLDYGCGHGSFSKKLAELYGCVIAVDSSEKAIALAKEKNQCDNYNPCYQIIKNNKLDFLKDNCIAAAMINFVLCTIPTKEEINQIIREIHRVLVPNGSLIICDPSPWSPGQEYVSFRREFPEEFKIPFKEFYAVSPKDMPDFIESGTPIKVFAKGMKEPFIDYHWSFPDYLFFLQDNGFGVDKTALPKPAADEKNLWKAETEVPPYLILRGRKWTE